MYYEATAVQELAEHLALSISSKSCSIMPGADRKYDTPMATVERALEQALVGNRSML